MDLSEYRCFLMVAPPKEVFSRAAERLYAHSGGQPGDSQAEDGLGQPLFCAGRASGAAYRCGHFSCAITLNG